MSQIININNINGNFFGGLPYNVSWNFNNGDSPSTLTVNVVSENGQYSDPKLDFSKIQSVTIGNLKFDGYLISSSFNKSPNQRTLELQYIDKSTDLNRYFVGLHKKHGDKNKNKYANLILVGKEYHPCDTNLDSTVDYEEKKPIIDPCDPCPFMPKEKYDKACDPVKTNFEIFNVYYTFNELISKIPKEFKVQFQDPNRYNNFRAQHIGTLKDVLNSWCSDLGLSYFWDPFASTLNFIDRKRPISIPEPPSDITIIDLNTGSTIENTFSRGFIASYEKQGEIKSYSCENEQMKTLKCLTIHDLYKDEDNGFNNDKFLTEADFREAIAIVSYLGQEARDAFLWFYLYKNLSAQSVANKIFKDKKNTNGKGKVLTYLGNMQILDVYYVGGNTSEIAAFWQLKDLIDPNELERMDAEDAKDGYTQENPSYYFFVAVVDEELAQKQIDTDINLARNFLGKYWYKKFDQSDSLAVPGVSNGLSVSVESPEGSAQWYPSDADLITLPIFNFGHEQKSKIGDMAKKLVNDSEKNEDLKKAYRAATADGNQSADKLLNLNSFILLDRDAKWSPNEDELKWYQTLFQWYKDRSPQLFSVGDGRPEILFSLYPDAKQDTNIKLFIGRQLKDFEVTMEKVSQHPLESVFRKQKQEDSVDIFGKTTVKQQGKWGLLKPACVKLTLPGITFFTPSQSIGNSNYLFGDGDAGFSVYVKASAQFPRVLPKLQYVYKQDPSTTNVGKVDFHLKQINDENIRLLVPNKCLIDEKTFQAYAKNISTYGSFEMTQPQKNMSFKTAGVVPLIYSPSQGLSSIQITIANDGVYTSYNFEDLIVQPPSDEYFQQYLKDLSNPKKSMAGVGSLTPDGASSLTNNIP